MRRVAIPVLVLAALVAAAAALAQPPHGIVRPDAPSSLPLRELGEQLYAGNCALCHGIAGRGVATPRLREGDVDRQGPPLLGVGPQAVDWYLRTGRMPLANPHKQPVRGRPHFSDREIRALVDYVDSLAPGGPPIPAPRPERGSLAEGKELFTEHCAGCHQTLAEGGVATGARVPRIKDSTPTEIAEAVRIGPYVMPPFSEKDISTDELDSIIAYVEESEDPVDRGGWGIGHIGPVPEGIVTWLVGAVALIFTCMIIGKRARS